MQIIRGIAPDSDSILLTLSWMGLGEVDSWEAIFMDTHNERMDKIVFFIRVNISCYYNMDVSSV